MKRRMGIMLLAAIVILLGSGTVFALGSKGDGMDHKGKGMMTNDGAMKKHDEKMKEETRKDEKKEEMKKDDGMSGGTMEKKDAMKDTMK